MMGCSWVVSCHLRSLLSGLTGLEDREDSGQCGELRAKNTVLPSSVSWEPCLVLQVDLKQRVREPVG